MFRISQVRWLPVAAVALVLAGCAPFRVAEPPSPPKQGVARWTPVKWEALPGWTGDRVDQAWPALLHSCQRPATGWAALCADAVKLQPRSERDVRRWFEQNLQPYSIQPLQGSSPGLLTGYYEPVLTTSRGATAKFRHPLYGMPADLAQRRPYWTRQQIDTLPAAQASLRGREIAYVADPLEALVLHIQGSGRMLVTEPGGKVRTVRLAYAGNNGHPYQSVGRWLIDRGELAPGQASWPEIKAWTQRNPTRINELLWANPRYVFFREEPLPDPTVGPRGAQGVPLTPGRSIAVDPQSVPYGTPVWIASTEPLSAKPLRRIVMAQDTGTAIRGAVRADYFWGWDASAAAKAGSMKQPLQMWALWPRR